MNLNFRNFEKEHVSKIKTVYPEAYELRQEKGIQNLQGFKQSGYQLTVAARLDDPGMFLHNISKENASLIPLVHLVSLNVLQL
jgi:hypothetical protein